MTLSVEDARFAFKPGAIKGVELGMGKDGIMDRWGQNQ
jgi:hypothetical protein